MKRRTELVAAVNDWFYGAAGKFFAMRFSSRAFFDASLAADVLN
jgi:hypothetical protein